MGEEEMFQSGENGAREQSEFGMLLKGGASIIALAAFSLAAPAYGQVAQGTTTANAPDQDPATTPAEGTEAAEQEAEGASSREATGAGAAAGGGHAGGGPRGRRAGSRRRLLPRSHRRWRRIGRRDRRHRHPPEPAELAGHQ